MATRKHYRCQKCGPKKHNGRLFDALTNLAHREQVVCGCGKPMELVLGFDLAMNEAPEEKERVAVAAFLPNPLPEWTAGSSRIVLYVFLVILSNDVVGRTVWLPYWHVVDDQKGHSKKIKWGQWSPFPWAELFTDLTIQAQRGGYLNLSRSGWKKKSKELRAPPKNQDLRPRSPAVLGNEGGHPT
jgi:hypothetical protein